MPGFGGVCSQTDGMAKTEPSYIAIGQMAHQLGVPEAWLKREADAGRLPCLRVGRRRMFAPDAVRAELDGRARVESQHLQHQEAHA